MSRSDDSPSILAFVVLLIAVPMLIVSFMGTSGARIDKAPDEVGMEYMKVAVALLTGLFAIWQYANQGRKSREARERELAIQYLAKDGFLVIAEEFEALGHSIIGAWMEFIRLRATEQAESALREMRLEWRKNGAIAAALSGGNTRFASALSRVSMVDPLLYYALINSFADLSTFARHMVFVEEKEILRMAKDSSWMFTNQSYMFGSAVAVKAAEILIEIEDLRLNATILRSSERMKRLAKTCEEFKGLHSALRRANANAFQADLNALNDWMIRAIEGPSCIGKI